MADKNVNIKITAESKEAEKAISKVTSAVNKLGKNSTLKSINSLASAVTNSISAFNTLKTAVEGVISTVNDCADAYAKQRSAELALETAAKNNPYLNASNVKALKNYATELSKLSGIADEDLLPTMTKLAQAGRTESEIMKIMSAATDIAASGVMGFEQACDALNKTFVGEMGSLKELNPQIAAMTAEQLKAGEAVEAMAKAYEGTAASMDSISGGAERLKNAFTSLKEVIGESLAAPINNARNALAKLIEDVAEAGKKRSAAKQEKEDVAAIDAALKKGGAVSIDERIRKYEYEREQIKKLVEEWEKAADEIASAAKTMSYGDPTDGAAMINLKAIFNPEEAAKEDAATYAAEYKKAIASYKITDRAQLAELGFSDTTREADYDKLSKKIESYDKLLADLAEAQREAAEAAREAEDATASSAAASAGKSADEIALEMIKAYEAAQKSLIEQIKYARIEALNEALSTLDLSTEEGMAEAERIAEEKGKILGKDWGAGFAYALAESTEGKVFYTYDELESRINSIADGLKSLVANSEGYITLRNPYIDGQLKKLEAMRSALERLALEEAARMAAELKEELDAALESGDWAGVADKVAGFERRMEELRDKIPEEELAGLAEQIAAVKDAIAAQEALEEFRASLEAAMPKADDWRELSDQLLGFVDGMEELRGKIPEEELKALEEQAKAVREALAAPELEGWRKLEQESKDIYSRIAEIEALAKEAANEEKLDLEKAYLEEVERLNELAAKKSADAWDAYVREMKEKINGIVSLITSNISTLMSSVSSACELLLETSENSLEATLNKLEMAYLSGEMDEEEYNEAVVKAKEEAAKQEYKIEMWEWAASILSATANTAEGVTKAIAQGGIAGIITGSIVAAAGAVQMASIIASKPIAPTFSTGGIVGGTSYTGDRVQAMLNSGEMVLNAGQQRNLFDSINSGNLGTGDSRGQSSSTQIMVNNSAANIVSAEPEVTEKQINVMIDMRVNSSMKKGKFNKALTQAEQSQSGKWYGS